MKGSVMPEKELQNVGPSWLVQAVPFCVAVILSCLGGVVNYLNKINKTGAAFSFFRLSLEIFTSGFVGIVVFLLCDAAGLDWSTTAAVVAISGHMGTRALFLLESTGIDAVSNFMKGNQNGNSERKTRTTKKAGE